MKNLFWGPVTGWWLGWWLHYATLKALPRPQVLILVRGEQSIWFFLTRLRMRTFHGCDLPSMEKNRKPGSPFEIDCCCPKPLVCILETFRLLNKLFNLQVLFHFTWTSQPTQFDSLRIIKCQLTTRSFSFGDIAIYQNHQIPIQIITTLLAGGGILKCKIHVSKRFFGGPWKSELIHFTIWLFKIAMV